MWRTQKNWPKELNMNIMAKTWFSSALWRSQNICEQLNLFFFKKLFFLNLRISLINTQKDLKQINRTRGAKEGIKWKRLHWTVTDSITDPWIVVLRQPHSWLRIPLGKETGKHWMSQRPSLGWDLQVCAKFMRKILLDESLGFCCKCSLKK